MRRFELHRDEDISGVSGTGVVVEGVEFSDGVVALRWKSENPSTVVYEKGIEAVERIHGHNGATRLVWVDPDPNKPPVPSTWRNFPQVPAVWEKYFGLKIKDPDGWRNEGIDFTQRVTEDEFNRLATWSTIEYVGHDD